MKAKVKGGGGRTEHSRAFVRASPAKAQERSQKRHSVYKRMSVRDNFAREQRTRQKKKERVGRGQEKGQTRAPGDFVPNPAFERKPEPG